MIRFVQSGDFHLDSPLESFEDSDARRLMLLDSFGQVVEAAREHEAQLLFLCGDLFDNEGIRRETLDYIREAIRAIPDVKVLAVPGNHDYFGVSDAWQELAQEGNFFLFTEFESLFLEDQGVMIHGAGFRNRTEPATILPELAVLDRRVPNFLLMHGDAAATSLYNPLSLDRLAGFDYCALGHRHEHQILGPRQNIVYAGNPCARNFLEKGTKGCVLGTYDDGRLDIAFKPFAFPAFHDLKVDVSNSSTHAALRDLISQSIRETGDYYRITMTGRTWLDLNLDYLARDFATAGLILLDDTRRPRDHASLKREATLQGVFTRRMLELSETDDRALEALEAGLDALENQVGR